MYSDGIKTVNEKSLSSLLRKNNRSDYKKPSNLSTRSYERSNNEFDDKVSKSL